MKSKFLEQVTKYKMPLFLLVLTSLLFCTGFCSWLWIVASLVTAIFFFSCSITEMLCVVMYSLSFSSFGFHYISTLGLAFVGIAVKYMQGYIKGSRKFYVLPYTIICLITVVFSFVHYKMDNVGLEQGIMFIALLFGSYLLYVMHDEINVGKCFVYLIVGLSASAVLAAISLLLANFSVPIYYFDGEYNRFGLFSLNCNFMAMTCLFAISYFIYEIVNGKGNNVVNVCFIIIAVAIGAISMSKAFLLICLAFAVYFVFICAVKYKTKSLKFIIPIVIVVAGLAVVFRQYIFSIVNRFTNSFNEGALFNAITTGRYEIWQNYLSGSAQSVAKLLFGLGLFNGWDMYISPHNVYIFLLNRVGLVGIIVICLLVYVYAKQGSQKVKITKFNCLPLLTFLVLSLEEQILSERFFLFLVFAIMLTLVPKSNDSINK